MAFHELDFCLGYFARKKATIPVICQNDSFGFFYGVQEQITTQEPEREP